MGIFFNRHLALFCSIFAAASLCGCILSYKIKCVVLIVSLLLLLALAIIFAFLKRHKAAIITVILCIAFMTLALLISVLKMDIPIKNAGEYSNEQHNITATVIEINYQNDFYSLYTVRINEIDDKKVSKKAALELEYNASLKLGDIISLYTTIEAIDKHSSKPQSFYNEGIFYYISSAPAVTGHKENLGIKLHKLNQNLSELIYDHIDGESGALVSALILGNKNLLSSQTIRDFRRAGISHTIAISGMHLSILMLLFDFVLKKLKLKKSVRGGIVILVALFYLALTGFSLSTVRAFIMSAMAYLAFIFREDSDMLTNLLLSLFIILLVSPYAIYDIGLWLSFLAVLGIFTAGYFITLFSDAMYAKTKPKSKYEKRLSPKLARLFVILFSSVIITIAANVFICLPAWLYFDEISLISVISNLIVSPFISIILSLAPIFILTSPISFLANTLGLIIQKTCELLLWIVSYLTSFSSITVSMNHSFIKPIVIFLSASLALCLILKFKRKWLIAIPPLIAAVAFALGLFITSQYYSQMLDLEYISDTESEMLLLRDGNEHIIIDISSGANAYTYNAYNRAIKNTATEISSFVITHYHNRHQSTLYKLFRQAIIKTLYLPYPQDIDEYYIMQALSSVALDADVDVVLYDSSVQTNISKNVRINLSQRVYLKRSTHPIFYFTLSIPTSDILFLSESSTENNIFGTELDNALDNSKTIILGAHGPKTKNSISLNTNDPKILIFADENIRNHYENTENNNFVIYENTSYIKLRLPK